MTIVLDTNILVSGLRSQSGPCHALLQAIPSHKFTSALSVPLFNEYLDVISRPGLIPASVTTQDKEAICDYLAKHSRRHKIHFLWRTILSDPKDDLVLELAVAAGARYIVTRNLKDFGPAQTFGVTAINPADFIKLIGGLP
ncbi:putative toxin-antitoxin system toxin component, PIN family [Prosthecobacter sp.]|uniref:putative toxin-antitoxin system toxin component, PIN family n=1 Tax=Prosthecobacter sp. TaxID=1965333 RepID=UPI003783C787